MEHKAKVEEESEGCGTGWLSKGSSGPHKVALLQAHNAGGCSLHRYEQRLWLMNNSGGEKDAGIHRYCGADEPLRRPRGTRRRRRKHRLIHITAKI